jgi:4-amino-4-deoxy-L-arabinose transferase-like glycosyltransferase
MNHSLTQSKTAPTVIVSFILCGLALRVIFWTGPTGSDDTTYFDLAAKFLSFRPFGELTPAVRLVFLAVIGAPAVLLDSMSAGIAVNVLLSLLNDLITIWIAYRHFGSRAAVAAAFVMAFCGINILYPSTLLPDTLLTTLFLSVLLLVERATESVVMSSRWMLAAGLATGAAYSVKETGILLFPPVALFVVLKARQREAAWSSPLAVYVVGILSAALLENTIYLAYTGHFFYRQIALARANDALLNKMPLFGDFVREAADHFVRFGTRHIAYGTVAMVAAVPLWIRALRGRGIEMLIALIGGFSLAYLLAGTQSLTQLVATWYQPRYCQPVIPFAALALAKGYSDAWTNGRGARLIAYGVALLVAVPSVLAAPLVSGNLYNEAYYRNVAAIVPLLDSLGKPIFLEKHEFEILRHFLARGNYSNLRPTPEAADAAGYYIVSSSRIPWSGLAEKIGAQRAFEFQADTRTYRRYFPTLELPDFSPISRRQVVVLEKPLKTGP